jgi:hypothetical protein
MFERFTDRARRVVVLAQEEAVGLQHNYIGTEHLLLGLIREREGIAAQALDCEGFARVDFFYEEATGRVLVNVVNTIPGFTPKSMFPLLWAASGLAYPDLVARLVDLAVERHAARKR